MKKNLVQTLTLLLCVILLVLCIVQNHRLEAYRIEMEREIENLKNELDSAIDNISYDLQRELENAAQPVDYHEVNLAGVDYESRSVSLDVIIALKQWSEDTAVSLITSTGDEKNVQHISSDGTGKFTASVNVPLETPNSLWLEAMVTTGGVSTRVDLEGFPDPASLLPLRSSGGGWSGPTYHKGILTLDFEQYLQWQYDSGTISNARYEICINDELVQTVNAENQGYTTFRLPTMSLECDVDDTVQLYFRCDDSFGLSYRFHSLEVTINDHNIVDSFSNDEMEYFWSTEAENCDH